MNSDLISIIIFYSLLLILYSAYRSKFEVQGKFFVLYKTKFGLKLMDKFSKFSPKLLKIIGDIGVAVGFVGMIAMFYILIKGTYNLIFVPSSMPVVSPVLPGITIPGLPTLSFWNWIISVFVVAIAHEFSHGVYARLAKVKIKSSGFAFLGPILAAFVEPEEKTLSKKTKMEQLRVFSAGPFGNIILFLIVFLISGLLVNPITASTLEYQGVNVVAISLNSPISKTNVSIGDSITGLNNQKIENTNDFINATQNLKPYEFVNLKTDKGDYQIKLEANPSNSTKGYMGVSVSSEKTGFRKAAVEKYGTFLLTLLWWISKLLFWIYMISFGIGLFNLLPLGPVDGGRMLSTGLSFFIADKKKVNRIWMIASYACVTLIIINLLPYVVKLFKFVIGLFS